MSDKSAVPDVEERHARELTEAEWRAVEAARTAQAIIGGEPLVPYDVTGMAKEIEWLRTENEALKAAFKTLDNAVECCIAQDDAGRAWFEDEPSEVVRWLLEHQAKARAALASESREGS